MPRYTYELTVTVPPETEDGQPVTLSTVAMAVENALNCDGFSDAVGVLNCAGALGTVERAHTKGVE